MAKLHLGDYQRTSPTLVSVIIPTRDSAGTLPACLESIIQQENVTTEIVIVDQSSQDSSRTIARRYGAKIIDSKRTGIYIPPSTSRNIGFSQSHGNYILHLDSDMELSSEELISACVELCDSADAVIIPETDVGTGFWAQCKTIERQCHVGRTWLESPRFFRRETLTRLSGYDPRITSGEDWDVTDRLALEGATIVRVPFALRHHLGTFSLRRQMMKKFSYGKTMHQYALKADNQMGRRIGSYAVAYLSSVSRMGSYTFPIVLMRSVEAMGLLAGMVLRDRAPELDMTIDPSPSDAESSMVG